MTGPATDTFGVFGTTAVLVVTDPAGLGRARAIADAELAAVDLACSRFRPDSELSRLNRAHGALSDVSELFAALIAEALRAAELTGGDVDPTCGSALVAAGYDRDFTELRAAAGAGPASAGAGPASAGAGPASAGAGAGLAGAGPAAAGLAGAGPAAAGVGLAGAGLAGAGLAGAGAGGPAGPVPGWRSVRLDARRRTVRLARGAQLDLGSTAKAWAADRCAGEIAGRLGCGVLVSLGGDVAVAGPPPGDGWQVRVTDDHAAPADAPGQTVTVRSGGLATSSTTVRTWTAGNATMHHIIDPRTGAPARSCWRTVSVAADCCADANIASTAAIIRSEAAPGWLTEAGLPARLVRHDGTVRTTPGWPADDNRRCDTSVPDST